MDKSTPEQIVLVVTPQTIVQGGIPEQETLPIAIGQGGLAVTLYAFKPG